MTARTLQLLMIPALVGAASAQGQWTAIRLHDENAYSSAVYAITASQQGGYRQETSLTSSRRAGIWTGGSFASFSVNASDWGTVYGMLGSAQVGLFRNRAAYWQGSSATHVDLHPPGALISEARAMTADSQVGWAAAGTTDRTRATVWHGTAASAVDLHPPGTVRSEGWAASGSQQGGWVQYTSGDRHAALWSGSAASFVDLNPPGIGESLIFGMAQGQQVGLINPPNLPEHAALWSGTASSMIDMHPFPGLGTSELAATTGQVQVGVSSVPGFGGTHAGAWFGTPGSFIDLNQFLPTSYHSSYATSVVQSGETLYIGGIAAAPITGTAEAWLWIGTIPAPGPASLLGLAGLVAGIRRREPMDAELRMASPGTCGILRS